ncbi:MAG: hypothetical protein ACLT98_15420 [Eggerthellaceae bacterium]
MYPLKQGSPIYRAISVGDSNTCIAIPASGRRASSIAEPRWWLKAWRAIWGLIVRSSPRIRKGWKLRYPIAPVDPHDLSRSSVQWKWLVACMNWCEGGALVRFLHRGQALQRLLSASPAALKCRVMLDGCTGEELKRFVDADDARICLTHNDFFTLNFLIDDQTTCRSSVDIPACPTATISARSRCAASWRRGGVACPCVLFRAPSAAGAVNFAFVALADGAGTRGRCSKNRRGHGGERLYVYYRYAKDYLDKVLDWYRQEATKGRRGFGNEVRSMSGLLCLDTVVLGIGLSMSPFIGTAEAIAFAAIASAAL